MDSMGLGSASCGLSTRSVPQREILIPVRKGGGTASGGQRDRGTRDSELQNRKLGLPSEQSSKNISFSLDLNPPRSAREIRFWWASTRVHVRLLGSRSASGSSYEKKNHHPTQFWCLTAERSARFLRPQRPEDVLRPDPQPNLSAYRIAGFKRLARDPRTGVKVGRVQNPHLCVSHVLSRLPPHWQKDHDDCARLRFQAKPLSSHD
jgi:hypothetical protein